MTSYLSNVVSKSLDRSLIYRRMLSVLLNYRSFPIGCLQILMGVLSSDVPVSPHHELYSKMFTEGRHRNHTAGNISNLLSVVVERLHTCVEDVGAH